MRIRSTLQAETPRPRQGSQERPGPLERGLTGLAQGSGGALVGMGLTCGIGVATYRLVDTLATPAFVARFNDSGLAANLLDWMIRNQSSVIAGAGVAGALVGLGLGLANRSQEAMTTSAMVSAGIIGAAMAAPLAAGVHPALAPVGAAAGAYGAAKLAGALAGWLNPVVE